MSGIVRAKFVCNNLVNPEGATAAQVGLTAVCRGIENALWAQATPSGSISMNVKNNPAFEQFELHAEYEVTFRKVEKPKPNDGHTVKLAVTMQGAEVCEFCGMHLGWTDEAVERESWKAQYNTEEKRAELLALHQDAYGAKAEDPQIGG